MIHDISPLISESIAVWPGDSPFTREWLLRINEGHNIDLSTVRTTVHLGAHADAPSHYGKDLEGISQVPLEPYLGACRVIEVPTGTRTITPEHCKAWRSGIDTRVLFKTGSFPDPNVFTEDFAFFAPETVAYLAEGGVSLIGIDTPSFDSFSSKDLPAHAMLAKYKLANLEGLVLRDVDEGVYELIALPLKLLGADASPVRAILRDF